MKRFVSIPALVLASLAACGDSDSSPTAKAQATATTPGPSSTSPGSTGTPGQTTPPPDSSSAANDAMTALLALGPSCSSDGWCWRGPTPSGNDYGKIFSTSPDNVWITGQHGTVLQWNGTTWRAHQPPVQDGQPLAQLPFSISGRGPNDMWIIYDATIQHWDGTAWKIFTKVAPDGITAINQVWAAPDGDTWATMSTGALLHSHAGGDFQIINSGCNCYMGNLWGTSSTDIYITTLGAGILHYDGTNFAPAYTGTKIAAAYTGEKDDVWVAGADNALLHFDGKKWAEMPLDLPAPNYFLSVLGRKSKDDIWFYGQLSSAQTAFIHWDGQKLTTNVIDTTDVGAFLYSGAIIGDKWWFVGGGGRVYTGTNEKLTPVISPPIVGEVMDMWGSSDSDMYFASGGDLWHYDGKTFTDDPRMIESINGIHGADGKNELFGTGFELTEDHLSYIALAWHFDGTTWTKTQLDHSTIANQQYKYLAKVRALGPGEAIAVGYKGIAYRFTNGAWKPLATNVTTDLTSVWSPDPDHAWVAGAAGKFLKWERANPDVLVPDTSLPATTADLGPIDGADGITWVGANTGIYKSNGAGWDLIDPHTVVGGLMARSATNVLVSAPGQSQAARWNGTAFVVEDINSGLAAPILFHPPNGTDWAAWSNVLLKHE